MLTHILLTDVLNEECLLPVDFLFANRGKVTKPSTKPSKKVVSLSDKKEEVMDCTLVHLHEELTIPVLETPGQILEKLIEAHSYGEYTGEYEPDPEPDDPDGEPELQELPSVG